MNSLRSSSVALRARMTPPAPLSSTRLLSSYSTSFSSPSKRSLSSASIRSPRIAASSRWSGSTSSLYRIQSRAMATESKIKVKNPVVELDGDEVRFQATSCAGRQLSFYTSQPLSGIWRITSRMALRISLLVRVPHRTRGKTGKPCGSCAN